jgi:hypothetical protein
VCLLTCAAQGHLCPPQFASNQIAKLFFERLSEEDRQSVEVHLKHRYLSMSGGDDIEEGGGVSAS